MEKLFKYNTIFIDTIRTSKHTFLLIIYWEAFVNEVKDPFSLALNKLSTLIDLMPVKDNMDFNQRIIQTAINETNAAFLYLPNFYLSIKESIVMDI